MISSIKKYIDDKEQIIDSIICDKKNNYKTFYIKKVNGKYRRIDEPKYELKSIQKWILNNLLDSIPISYNATAYIKKRTIKDNVKVHLGKEKILKIDLKDFFYSIKYDKVQKIFFEYGFDDKYSTILSEIVTYRGSLPQGAPTSPSISNIIFKTIDEEINEYARINNIEYTRYADDMIFSGNIDFKSVYSFVKSILLKLNLKINKEKIKFINKNCRQTITGVVVNKKLQVDKDQRKKIRQEMYYINKFGIKNHLTRIGFIGSSRCYIEKLEGRIGWMLFINKEDKELNLYFKQLKILENEI